MIGAAMSSSVHMDNKNKGILILGKKPTQGLDDTTLTSEPKYPISFTQPRKRFVLSLQYNRSNSFLLVDATKIYQFKAKDSEIKDYTMCLDNVSKSFTINNMKKTGLKGNVHFFLLILILLVLMIVYSGSCNTLNDWSNKVCVSNKTKDLNLRVFHIITGINELKTLTSHILWECKCKFDDFTINNMKKTGLSSYFISSN